jgi:hypothetical protein
LRPKDKSTGNIRSRIQSIPIGHLTRKGINATPSPRSCDGPRTSQGREITCQIDGASPFLGGVRAYPLLIQDAKFAWYKKSKFFAKK